MMGQAGGRPPEDQRRSALRAALDFAELPLDQLWIRYFALGGTGDLMDLDAHLTGLVLLPPAESNLLAHAINERLDELVTERRVPYTRPMPLTRPTAGPLAALVDLLGAAGSSPPERLPALTASAGRALGVDIEVHLIDHEQRALLRLPADGTSSPNTRRWTGPWQAGRSATTSSSRPTGRTAHGCGSPSSTERIASASSRWG
ncbi:hypothetical protein [Blastococcus brunescens]|uniref:Uncharacterized protein n=1 Tax=Blastococcus brunescens TaxID=1564165 RepID=A0ABZ1B8Q9_9ACTN|nr:hypothetical protein [Blastococcus sp. BMG 8361]WRL66293.1 hypothetical protein U6N30_13055 [Blastococcus sp. BMG 8361]